MSSQTTDKPAETVDDDGGAYRVLARKYRPQTFDDLIGQDPIVRTLQNAFKTDRIAQAYMLTGVRGVGKTTTARLIARALNYARTDDDDEGPSIEMPEIGVHCRAILDSRHVDVIEMDAASRTGIEDVREIIESVRYKPVSARYKIYIIDEVHMLSRQAFNALLKTLEEPPEHVKFIFATTEIRKVPVTVLSRCQRFDLRRLDADPLVKHFGDVAKRENAEAEDEALALIARAAEGSVRDGLSLLDQAIAFGGSEIKAEHLREMLGLVDRARIIDLFERLMNGDAAGALSEMKDHGDLGADPATVLGDLAELVHWITRLKVVPEVRADATHSQAERERGKAFAESLSMPILARAWQMLLKGIPEVDLAANPAAAADMVLIRMAYAADLPTPEDAVRTALEQAKESPTPAASQQGSRNAPAGPEARAAAQSVPVSDPAPAPEARTSAQSVPASDPAPAPEARTSAQSAPASDPEPAPEARTSAQSAPASDPEPAPAPEARTSAQSAPAPDPEPVAPPSVTLSGFPDVVALAGERRDIKVKTALETTVRLVRFAPGRLEIALQPEAPPDLPNTLTLRLEEWTGERWVVSISEEEGEAPLAEQKQARQQTLFREARETPTVKAALETFPGAEIVDVRDPDDAAVDGTDAAAADGSNEEI